jgi:hypothetical protein
MPLLDQDLFGRAAEEREVLAIKAGKSSRPTTRPMSGHDLPSG